MSMMKIEIAQCDNLRLELSILILLEDDIQKVQKKTISFVKSHLFTIFQLLKIKLQ